MPKSLKVKVGNKAKSRQHDKGIKSGYYANRKLITEMNRKRKQVKHLKRVEQKAQKLRLLNSLPLLFQKVCEKSHKNLLTKRSWLATIETEIRTPSLFRKHTYRSFGYQTHILLSLGHR